VVGLPAGGCFDSAALELFAAGRTECRWRILERGVLASELAEALRRDQPAAVCITALSERSYLRARRWCKQVLREVESLRIVVGLWGIELAEELPGPGIPVPEGCEVATSASATWKVLHPWLTLEPLPPSGRAEQDEAQSQRMKPPASALQRR
jgi:hypothetical protein